jgi:hypothetical protein
MGHANWALVKETKKRKLCIENSNFLHFSKVDYTSFKIVLLYLVPYNKCPGELVSIFHNLLILMIQFVVVLWATTNSCYWGGKIFTELLEKSLRTMNYIYIYI